ncbi:histone H1, orphon-like [Macrosteles quadrilineatus]|uniref:histone H1, orphon-like n=1 Tax=Macrosteles quadrilineatus TaxID=74068 RepID=UPI0023E33D6D|nr:histone H1, orphon-like [Macrosteles quadrilineatus]
MADSATSAPAPATATPKKSKAAAASKKPRVKPAHPPTSDMVNAAIKNLKERGGSSLQAIKKYIAANYKVDAEKLAPFIRKYLKSAVASGTLTQPKGKGASGSFKLSVKGEGKTASAGKKPAKKPAAAKPKGEKKPKVTAAKKTPKKAAAAKPKAAKVAKSPKAKKVSKPPTKKPKSPKPKKAAVKKPKTPKKAAAKKK